MARTRSIPEGTMNLSCNVTVDEWALLEAASVRFDSFGDLLRTLIHEGAKVRIPEVAAEIHAVRRKYGRHVVATALLAVGLLSIGQSWFQPTDLRRAKGKTHIAKLVKKSGGRTTEMEGEV